MRMRFGFLDVGDVVEAAIHHSTRLSRHHCWPKDREHYGGYLCITRRSDGGLILIAKVGECPPEKEKKYLQLAQEKAARLQKFASEFNHVSSWQTRNETAQLYGGAIVASQFIFSFSGLPEKADESLVLTLAKECGIGADIAQIMIHSHNEFFPI